MSNKTGYRMQDTRYIMHRASCILYQAGFTLVELLITMVVFVLVIAAASQVFTGLLTQFKQQSKIAETNIEGIVGLEILRQDIEHAGYGLPWNGLINYSESSANPFNLNDAPTNPPRAILTENNADFSGPNNIFGGSDYLVIKAVNVAANEASRKWTILQSTSPYTISWTPASENLDGTDRVIVLSLGGTGNPRSLIVSDEDFSTEFSNVASLPWLPADPSDTRIVYGINGSTAGFPERPFNRTDYYIWRDSTNPATDGVPDRCAPNTGVLRKAMVNHTGGTFQGGILPLLDCVADMQIVYGIDIDTDGAVNCYVNNLSDVLATVDAPNIRDRVKEVRVYILAHEGQYDRDFTFNAPIPPSSIRVGELSADLLSGSCTGDTVLGRDFDLGGITNWQNYRWKIYTLVVRPNNLR